jgi:hypothetical protein
MPEEGILLLTSPRISLTGMMTQLRKKWLEDGSWIAWLSGEA